VKKKGVKMKKMLLLIVVFSFGFSGTFYVELGQSPQYTVNDVTTDLDLGGLTIGYNHGFFQKGNWSVSVGGSYTLNPITGVRNNALLRFVAPNSEAGFISAYLLPVYQIGEKFFAWASFGINKGLYDLEDHDNGNTLGYGIHVKCNDIYGVGFGFTNNTVEFGGVDFDFNRTSIFLTAKIN